jgi:hypothetical protein
MPLIRIDGPTYEPGSLDEDGVWLEITRLSKKAV